MSGLVWTLIGLFVGSIFGYFVAALMMMSKVSDLEYELITLKENQNQTKDAA